MYRHADPIQAFVDSAGAPLPKHTDDTSVWLPLPWFGSPEVQTPGTKGMGIIGPDPARTRWPGPGTRRKIALHLPRSFLVTALPCGVVTSVQSDRCLRGDHDINCPSRSLWGATVVTLERAQEEILDDLACLLHNATDMFDALIRIHASLNKQPWIPYVSIISRA